MASHSLPTRPDIVAGCDASGFSSNVVPLKADSEQTEPNVHCAGCQVDRGRVDRADTS